MPFTKKASIYILLVSISFLLFSCSNSKRTTENTIIYKTKDIIFAPGPQTIVYKTYKDFSNNIPIIMDKGRNTIVSYPAPSDVYYEGKLAKPTSLMNSYLLDNKGIDENVAFLKYTYEEYSQLDEAPSKSEMLANIAEKYPLTELIYCGIRSQYKDEVKELNQLINKGFPGCKKAKIMPMHMIDNN